MRSFNIRLFLASLIALGVAMFFHAKLLECKQPGQFQQSEIIPSVQTVKLVTLGFDQIVADYYWLQFVGYVGDVDTRSKDRYQLAGQYLELITQLDPNFVQAYWFAAFVIGGDGKRPQEAARIIDFGIEQNPQSWYLPFIAGVNQYLYAQNEVKASRYYRQAARYPGAPDWLERQAAILETEAPRLVKEAYSWLTIYESATEERVKEHAAVRCIALWVQVYKSAPNEAFRSKARKVLGGFGVDIDALARGR